jgi:hypothetical protein
MMERAVDKELKKNERMRLLHLIDQAFCAQSNRDFFRCIVKVILPKIHDVKTFVRPRSQWIQGKEAFIKERSKLINNIPEEIECAFESIKERVRDGEVKHPIIFDILCSIDNILRNKIVQAGLGSLYTDNAYFKMQLLLEMLLDLGPEEIVLEYAKIKLTKMPMISVFTGEMQLKMIAEYTFAPSLVKARQLDRSLYQKNVQQVWIALELLYIVEWCWNSSESVFDEKESSYQDSELHKYWLEMRAIKKNERIEGSSFFDKNKFLSCLATIVKAMFDEGSGPELISVDALQWSSLELKLVTSKGREYLLLELIDVYNYETLLSKTFIIHNFQDTESSPFQITRKLFDLPDATWINVTEICQSDGIGSSAKYLERIKMQNILGKVFFDRDGIQIRLNSRIMRCIDLSRAQRQSLQAFIQNLKVFQNFF